MQTDNRFLPPGLAASLSGPIGTLSESPISDVAMSVFGDPDVVPRWFGEGDLVTPDLVREAAAQGKSTLIDVAIDPAASHLPASDY